MKNMKWAQIFILVYSLLIGCVDNQGMRSAREKSLNNKSVAGSGNPSGQSAVAGDSLNNLITDITEQGKSEIRHIVDPFDGTFRQKVTIPKNFTGLLYLSGINLTALNNRLVSVRFNFGREMESVTIPATIGRAEGLTPQIDIGVLILDMTNRPFENIRLLYDLYDYNDYRDSNGVETGIPTQDNRNKGLYCRGLRLEHDPTFVASSSNTKCDTAGERCLYAYAKIVDSGLYKLSNASDPTSTKVAISPSEPQIDLTGGGFVLDSISNQLKKCLPDNFNKGELSTLFNNATISANAQGVATFGSTIALSGTNYTFNGPFRAIGESQWEIGKNALSTSSAVFYPVQPAGIDYPTGLFQSSGNSSLDPNAGYNSFLFPRGGKMSLQADLEYFGSVNPWGDGTDSLNPSSRKSLTSLVSAGDSSYVYGCNLRATNFDKYLNEGTGSCNVSATIEIITQEDGKTIVLNTAKEVKLQLVRSSLSNFQGLEVLYTSMKSCSSSKSCGAAECCFNNRCWDRGLVSQCLDEAAPSGNRQVGENCTSDYECASLCCNKGTTTCAVHTNLGSDPVLCGKTPGEQCVAKEWCRKENLADCYVVKTGTSPTGAVECALRCYNIPTYGNCRDGQCVTPQANPVPVFNPTNPDCSTARDPLTTVPN